MRKLHLLCLSLFFIIEITFNTQSQDVMQPIVAQQPFQISQILSPTPIPANIPRNTPLPVFDVVATATFTPTATEQQFVTLSVREDILEGVNVRAEPDPDSAGVGVISQGEVYPVTGRYFLWLRLRYEGSPSGQAWVFSELVTVTGDQTLIPDLSQEPEATTDATVVGATQTWQVITLTPGGELTATANGRLLGDPISVVDENNTSGEISGSSSGLPTFTPPPNSVIRDDLETFEQQTRNASVQMTTIPPILPIILLGGLGLVGFALSSIRK